MLKYEDTLYKKRIMYHSNAQILNVFKKEIYFKSHKLSIFDGKLGQFGELENTDINQAKKLGSTA